MDIAIYFIQNTALALVGALTMAMFLRSIMSFFDPTGEGKFTFFLATLTEPIIYPVRALCTKFHWFEGTPIDVPHLITFFILILLETLIGSF